jgi:hypothetical protein
MSRFKWAVLGAATMVAVLVVIAPGASSAPSPGLKITSVVHGKSPVFGQNTTVRARCPDGYSVVGGGFTTSPAFTVETAARSNSHKYVVFGRANAKTAGKRGVVFLASQAICAKGIGGFDVRDDGSGFP